MTKTVDIVKVSNPDGWAPKTHHVVEEEKTHNVLFETDTQKAAEDWAKANGYAINIHRERNRKPGDKHGQFRKQ